MKKTVQIDHVAYYDNPIALGAGEALVFSGRADAWEDNPNHIWLWAIAEDGREGWLPEGFAIVKDGKATAPREYFARELSVVAGEDVAVLRDENGWAWCENNRGDTGWVPLKTFYPTDNSS